MITTYFKNCGILILFILLSSCGGSDVADSNNSIYTHKSKNFLDSSNAEIKKEGGKAVVFHKGKPFTGVLVHTYSTKQAVKKLMGIEKGEFTGVESYHGGEKTIGSIKTMTGHELRLPQVEEEITETQDINYYDGTGKVRVVRNGYMEYSEDKQHNVFIRHGKVIEYNEDGTILREKEYVKGEEVK